MTREEGLIIHGRLILALMCGLGVGVVLMGYSLLLPPARALGFGAYAAAVVLVVVGLFSCGFAVAAALGKI